MESIYSIIALLIVCNNIVVSAPTHEEEVKVILRSKRSSNFEPHKLLIKALGRDYNLNLKNSYVSIFSPNIQVTTVALDANGEEIFHDVTPSKSELIDIEDKHFIDHSTSSAVKFEITKNLELQLQGVIDGFSIRHDATNHYHVATEVNQDRENTLDYIDLNRNITNITTTDYNRAATKVIVEIFIVVDNANYKTFHGNTTAILDYLGVFFHAVNNRFATFSDPMISLRICGVTSMTSPAAQPFMENGKILFGNTRKYDVHRILHNFSVWMYRNRNSVPKYDVATVLSGEELYGSTGMKPYSSTISGSAYLRGACWFDANTLTGVKSVATSVIEDKGGYYDGVIGVAHELAHNLGAVHDGSLAAKSCPSREGYIMSTSLEAFGKKNKFYFSNCSRSLMRAFIMTEEANCLRSIQNTNQVPLSKDNPGDRYDMTVLCKKYSQQPAAVVDDSVEPSDLCKNLVCRYPTPGEPDGWVTTLTLNHPPGDNSVCGIGGRCINGNCKQRGD